jgi:hypothetical protein
MDDITDVLYFRGNFNVEFVNGDKRSIFIKRMIVNHLAHPLYFEDEHGDIYNWSNVIRVVKRDS